MTLKRFLSISLALALTATFLTLPAYAAGNDFTPSKSGDKFYLCALEEIPYVAFPGIPNREEKKTVSAKLSLDGTQANSFNDLYGMFSAPATALWASMKPTNPMKVWFAPGTTSMQGTDNKRPITEKTSLAMMMANLSGDELNVSATQKIEVKDRNARLGICNINGTVKLSVPGMSVTNGNLLIRNAVLSGTSSTTPVPVLEVHLSEPITVGTGGNLYLDIGEGQASPLPGTGGGPVADKLVAPTGKSAIILDGGTAHLGAFLVERAAGNTSAVPLVAVNSGNLIIEEGSSFSSGADGMPDYTPGTLGPVADWHTTITNGDSNQPTVQVANGATLTLKGGEIKATGTDTPAVQVAAGATVEIPTDSKTIVTASSNNSQAIDLADGATVKKGDIVTVVVSDTNGSDNYVDNNGNIILAKGAKTGESENQTLNAAVILPDGTLIQGSEDTAPSVTTTNGNTTVTIPAGGSVQKPDGTTQNLTAGGTATSTPKDDGGTDTKLEVTAVPVTNVNLNQANLSLREGSTATLTATVEPADATNKNVTWTSSDQKVATVDANGTVTAVAPGTAIITAAAGEKTATCTVTVTKPSSGSSGSGSSSTTTQTTTNPDGSTTTTVTNKKTGTVTETTKYKDGSTLAVETKKDGTVTTTATAVNGVKTVTVEKPGEKVTAAITLPAGVDAATVTIPADLTPGTVAVDTKTGEIVMLSVPTEDGMLIKVEGSAKLVLEDRSKDFIDTPGHWGEDAIDFAVAHEMFNGTSETTFTPDGDMTRAMLMTVLARFDGQDTTGGETWYEKGMEWAKANGVSDGANPNAPITREQLVTMLYRYVGSPAADGSLASFPDAGKVSAYAADAMTWAVGTGILNGMGDGTLAPQGSATRAQVATILMRFCENVAK